MKHPVLPKQISYEGALQTAQTLGIEEGFLNILTQIEFMAGPDSTVPGKRHPQREVFAKNNAPSFTFFHDLPGVVVPPDTISQKMPASNLVLQRLFSQLDVSRNAFSATIIHKDAPFRVTIPLHTIIYVTDSMQPQDGLMRLDYVDMLKRELEADADQERSELKLKRNSSFPPRSAPEAPGQGTR